MLKVHSQRFADVEDGYAAYIISVAEFAPKMLKSRLPAITKGRRKRNFLRPFLFIMIVCYSLRPWQCLYFLPLPQGQGSLRPTFFST